MCDKDIVEKVAKLLNDGKAVYIKSKNEKWKDSYRATVKGARARALMKELKPLMGERRQGQISRALKSYDHEHSRLKLDASGVRTIRELAAQGVTNRTIAERYKMNRSHIARIVQHKKWKWVI